MLPDVRQLVALLVVLAATPARAEDDVAAFYKGKQLRFVVGTAPGGTYDILARIVARHMPSHIPGNPTVVVQNLPAAGGLVMTNQLYAQGPKDGTTIGVPINGIPTAPLLQPGPAHFDPNRLIWVGSTNREAYVAYVWHTAPVQSLAALMTTELVVGGTTPGTTMIDFPLLTNDILGTRFRIVRGYESSPQMNQAMERGEVQGVAALGWAAVKAQMPHWIADKKIKMIAQFGFHRSPELADVPLILDLAKSDADRQALSLLFARTEYGRPYFLPPDVPPERVAALRRAFDATMKDPAFIADAAKIQLAPDPMTGEEVQTLVAKVSNAPADVAARVRAALAKP